MSLVSPNRCRVCVPSLQAWTLATVDHRDSVLPADPDPVRWPSVQLLCHPFFLAPSPVGSGKDAQAELSEIPAEPHTYLFPTESDIRPNKLLTWCQQQTEGYQHVHVTDLTTSWRSGLALCAIIHRFRPELM